MKRWESLAITLLALTLTGRCQADQLNITLTGTVTSVVDPQSYTSAPVQIGSVLQIDLHFPAAFTPIAGTPTSAFYYSSAGTLTGTIDGAPLSNFSGTANIGLYSGAIPQGAAVDVDLRKTDISSGLLVDQDAHLSLLGTADALTGTALADVLTLDPTKFARKTFTLSTSGRAIPAGDGSATPDFDLLLASLSADVTSIDVTLDSTTEPPTTVSGNCDGMHAPEPTSLTLGVLGGIVLFGFRWRRCRLA